MKKLISFLLLLLIVPVVGATYIDVNGTGGSRIRGLGSNSTAIFVTESGKLAPHEDTFIYTYNLSGSLINEINMTPEYIYGTSGVDWYDGLFYITSFNNQSVYIYDYDGNKIDSFSTIGQADFNYGIATNGTYIWIVELESTTVFRYNMSGTYLDSFSTSGYGSNNMDLSINDESTHIYVLDRDNKAVYIYDMDGVFNSSFSVSDDIDFGLQGISHSNGLVHVAQGTDSVPKDQRVSTWLNSGLYYVICGDNIIEEPEQCEGGTSCTDLCVWESSAGVVEVFKGGGSIGAVLKSWNPETYVSLTDSFKLLINGNDFDSFTDNFWETLRLFVLYVLKEPATLGGSFNG